jgi:predicted metal-dependent peptidase
MSVAAALASPQQILEEIAKTGIDLLTKGEPFFAHLLGGLNRQIVQAGHPVDTLAVGLTGTNFTLFVNADFWTGFLTKPEHRRGVLKHELLHLVFQHLRLQDPTYDYRLLNIALDLVVNQYVDVDLLPVESIFLNSFPELMLMRDQTWFYYYQQLQRLEKNEDGKMSGSKSLENLQSIQSNSHGLERHEPWREIRSKSEVEKSVVEVHLENMFRTAHQRTNAHAWGKLPENIKELIGKMLHKPKSELDWRAVLKLFSESAFKTNLRNTMKRPSKRFGTIPGIKIRKRQRLLIAIDTSGSIGPQELEQFFGEIYHIWRAGAQVEVVECDVVIHQKYAYKGVTPTLVQGRGGTDFIKPLEMANEERYDAVIYFTDGFADTPDIALRLPVLWLITKAGLKTDHAAYQALPGRKVKMKM